jgi:ferritin-like metal-binding protein YciE
MRAGSKIAAEATDNIYNMASNEELKQSLKEGSNKAEEWLRRIETGLNEAGGSDENSNEIIKAHVEVSRRIMEQASDDYSRDLGIIASGQLALHYWIAAFGTQHSYAEAAGLQQAASNMKMCVEEAKAADEKYTQIAQQIMSE